MAKTLKKAVLSSSKGLYHLEFEDLDIRPLLGKVSLLNVKLIADTNVYKQLQREENAPQTIYTIKIEFIQIRGINQWNYFQNKTLAIENIIIHRPHVKILKNQLVVQKKNHIKKDLYDIISPIFKETVVSSIKATEGSVFYELINTKSQKSYLKANNFSLLVDGLRLNKPSEEDTSRLFYSDNIRFIVNHYQLRLPDSLNTIKFDQLQLSTQDSSILVTNFNLQPRFEQYLYAKAAGKQTDRLDLKIDSSNVRGIHFRTLLFDEKLIIEQADFSGLQLYAFRDKRVPMKNEKAKVLVHELLKNTTFPILVQYATIRNSRVDYEEFAPKGISPGTIFFSSLNAQFKNITNNESAEQKNMLVNVSSYFMGVGELKTEFIFPISKSDHTFRVTGSLGRMDLRVVNKAVESLAMVKLKTGRVNHLDFDIKANNIRSSIKMKFLYSNLVVTVLDPETGEKKGLASTLLNALILDSDNPLTGKAPRKANATFARNQQKQIFNFLWKTLYQGIKRSIGIDQEDENKLKKLSDKYAKKSRQKNKTERKREQKLKRAQYDL
ncbi:hypothetical protein [Solitalea koreensis]|uniref:hypothetical protein n=1 Tax=Solitalea koreensis TaxID=543615 RepID=UPI00163DC4DA|nr:hypothetical protein [Solitalea koreensis]